MARWVISSFEYEQREIDLRMDPEMPRILGDERLLAHALRCVVDNAVRYSPESTNIRVSITATDNDLLIDVTDQGIGIPASETERIFEPGFQGSNAKMVRATGLGMGLAVARRILNQHGGDVRLLHSDHPTQFILELPIGRR